MLIRGLKTFLFFPRAVMIMLSCWGKKKSCKKTSKISVFKKSVTFQKQHLTFASSSHQTLGWSNTFHSTLLVWFLYKNTPWGAPWSWQSSSLTIMSCYLCVVFDYHFLKANSWSAEGRGRKGWVGMGCYGIMLAGQFTFKWKFMDLSTKTSLKRKNSPTAGPSWSSCPLTRALIKL